MSRGYLLLLALLFLNLFAAGEEVVADRAADVLLTLLAPVPLGFAGPVYLACFAAIDFMTMVHNLPFLIYKVQHLCAVVN